MHIDLKNIKPKARKTVHKHISMTEDTAQKIDFLCTHFKSTFPDWIEEITNQVYSAINQES